MPLLKQKLHEPLAVITLVAIVAGLMAGFGLRGDFKQLIFVICVGLYCGIPIVVLGLVSMLIALIRGRSSRSALRFSAFGLIIISGALFSLSVGKIFQSIDIAEAKAYPAKVAPLLEKYRKEHGSYPAKVELLSATPTKPRVANFIYGTKDGHSYYFRFPEPGQGFGFDEYVYNSEARTWRLVPD